MTLTGMVDARRVAAVLLALALVSGLFLGNQRHAQASTLAQQIICFTDQQLGPNVPFNPQTDYCGDTGGDEDNGDGDTPNPNPSTECSDGIDNDGDGFIDFVPVVGDPGCDNIFDDSEGSDVPPPPPPTDVCPNLDGLQESMPEGYHNDGGNCVADDNGNGGGEENPGDDQPSSGGGHHSSGSHHSSGGVVLGAEDCSQYLTAFIRIGQNNDNAQVLRLQSFLHDFENMDVPTSGIYDQMTLAAVHTFQTKYASDILTPWGIGHSTGFVFYTTQKKVNELYCKGTKQFPLSESAEQLISKVRAGGYVPAPISKPAKVTSKVDLTAGAADSQKTETNEKSEDKPAETSTPKPRGFWGGVGDFFSRMIRFGR